MLEKAYGGGFLMSAGVWYGKRTWLGLGFALVLALALDALGALLLARGMVPMAAARVWTLGSWAAGGFCGTRMAVRAECGSLPVAAAVGLGLYGIVWAVGLAAWQAGGFRWDVTVAETGAPPHASRCLVIITKMRRMTENT